MSQSSYAGPVGYTGPDGKPVCTGCIEDHEAQDHPDFVVVLRTDEWAAEALAPGCCRCGGFFHIDKSDRARR